jgi:YrbI family 3-deoxy-D-manno-octulosonate 8-phosphate phosphatase
MAARANSLAGGGARAYQTRLMSRTPEKTADTLAVIHAGDPHIAAANPLLRVAGRPLIAHGILAAKAATSIERVSVATGDAGVAALAASLGAGVIRLPAPMAPSADILAETLDRLRREGDVPEIAVFIDYRLPLTAADDVDGTVAALIDANADCALAVTSVGGTLWRAGDAGVEAMPPACVETGAVFAVRTARCAERAGHTALERVALYLMPAERAVAVHHPFPLAVIETLMAARARANRLDRLPRKPAALVMDFDGVFTDNRVLVDETGREAVLCNRSDGLGLEQLRARGLPMLVLSKEQNPVVQARCRKLKLECLQGVDDKRPALEAWCRERRLPLSGVIYIGNDTNDLACFEAVGCAVAVADAHEDAIRAADVSLAQNGGCGALRELTDLIAARLTSPA